MACAWYEKNQYDNAITDFDEAIRLDPDARSYVDRGDDWFVQDELDKAIADYNEAIRLDPHDARAYLNRGLAWLNKKEYDKAIADTGEAIRLYRKRVGADGGVEAMPARGRGNG